MKQLLTLPFLALAACGGEPLTRNSAAPDLNLISEAPGDWSALQLFVGRAPASSGLFVKSPISVDLNAMLGPSLDVFRNVMADGTPLFRDGPVLVSLDPGEAAYLVIQPDDHAMEVGIRQRNLWRIIRTPGAEVPRPRSVRALVGDQQPSV